MKIMNKQDAKEAIADKGAYRRSKQVIAKRDDVVQPNSYLYV